MDFRAKIKDRISNKSQEIRELEIQLRESRSYLAGLQDALDMTPEEPTRTTKVESPDEVPAVAATVALRSGGVLRPGSDLAKTRDLLLGVGKPLHISEILAGIGKEITRNNRDSLAGTLGPYVRRDEIFKRAGPNTFGLTEFPDEVEEGPNELALGISLPPRMSQLVSTAQNETISAANATDSYFEDVSPTDSDDDF